MARLLQFAEFRLDPVTGRLWRKDEPQDVTPKAFALLFYLASRPHQLISKEQLLNALWGDAFVGDAVLKVAVGELRKVLDDDPKEPRFIETVHRRGYRFIGEAEQARRISGLVGRAEQLERLQQALDEALAGRRQAVFITGEPGIGKSTLLEAFLESVPGHALVARGQSLQHYGEGEPYLPVLDALGRLARAPGFESFVSLFRRHAPTWLAQMPSLIPEQDRDALSKAVLGATRERMLREMAEALETLTADRPLILALEDLHWCDLSTVDLVSALAWRTIPARFLLIGTYRPVEVIVHEHPIKAVKQDLIVQGRAIEIALDLLNQSNVNSLIAERCPKNDFPTDLTSLLHERTNGNPLFLVNVLDFAVRFGDGCWSLRAPLDEIATEVPDSLRQMIGKQIERLPPAEQEMLEAAAVAGIDFSTIAVGAGLAKDYIEVEELCERLARRGQFLASSGLGELPDGTVAARFHFLHPLYQTVLYQRIGPARRVRLHQRIGEKGEQVYGQRVREIAAELAMQFESARDDRRAVQYLRWAAENALRRYANREAVDFLTRAITAAAKFPEPDRSETEVQLLEERGFAHRSMGAMQAAAQDFAAAVEYASTRTERSLHVTALLYQVSALSWLDHDACLRVADEAVILSNGMDNEVLRAHARGYCGYWHFVLRGWREQDAQASRDAIRALRFSSDPALLALHLSRYSYFESMRSEYNQAVSLAEEGMALAFSGGDAFEYILAQYYRIWALFFSGRWGEMRRGLDESISLAASNGHRQWTVLFRLLLVWLQLEVEDFAEARLLAEEGLDAASAVAHPLSRQIALVLLGFARLGCGEVAKAQRCFTELTAWLEGERVLMDWIWRMPLCLGHSRCAFETGDLAAAHRWADDLCTRAGAPGERTWLALGRLELARIAWKSGDAKERTWQLDAGFGHARGNAPLAERRLHEFAAQVDALGSHGQQFERIVTALRDSLDENDPMRQSGLFRRVLGDLVAQPAVTA